MAVLNVPAMGDSITEGTLLSIEKPVGQAIKADEVLATLETDKVRPQPAPARGSLPLQCVLPLHAAASRSGGRADSARRGR